MMNTTNQMSEWVAKTWNRVQDQAWKESKMFSDYEIDLVNAELAEMADEATNAAVDLQYDAMMEEFCQAYWEAASAEHESMMYASHSYDEDAIHYGKY
jgi:hypothetical protein